jgi:hypothetical protein
MNKITLLIFSLIAICFAFAIKPAWSDPGTNGLTDASTIGAAGSCRPTSGNNCFFAFDDGDSGGYAGNSEVFFVPDIADICLDTNIAATTDGGSAVTIYRVVTGGGSATANTSIVPSASATSTLNHDSGDCFRAVTGSYWLETTTNPSAGVTSVVSVTGRGN